jgi:sugar porter (SP) family MFS transporter
MPSTTELGLPSAACDLEVAASPWRRTPAAAICSLGGMVFGYDLGALSGATQGLTRAYTLSPALFGLTVSASLWGAMCASPIAGRLANRLGRRGLLAVCAGLYALAAVALALPVHWPWSVVLALRLLSGLAVGGFVVGCPLYLAEIAPRVLRGRFVGWFQLQIGMGAVAAFAVSAIIASGLPEIAEWRWCFGLGALPPACFLLLLHWVPEEPHWLARRGRWSEAAASAARLGFAKDEWPVEQNHETLVSRALPEERLFQRRYLRPILLAASVALFNQLCGVTVLRVYLLDLLSSTGMGRLLSHRYGVILALLNLAALLLGMMIVDQIGRRPLLIAGSAGMALCLFLLVWGLRHHTAAPFYLYILAAYNTFFACSQGAVAWVYLSEIFPFPVRGKGQGFGALVHWIANASLIWLFPVMEHALPQISFLLFASLMILQIAIVSFWYPETKGTRLGAVAEVAQPLAIEQDAAR